MHLHVFIRQKNKYEKVIYFTTIFLKKYGKKCKENRKKET